MPADHETADYAEELDIELRECRQHRANLSDQLKEAELERDALRAVVERAEQGNWEEIAEKAAACKKWALGRQPHEEWGEPVRRLFDAVPDVPSESPDDLCVCGHKRSDHQPDSFSTSWVWGLQVGYNGSVHRNQLFACAFKLAEEKA